jgi:tetrahedral aminopeptidase
LKTVYFGPSKDFNLSVTKNQRIMDDNQKQFLYHYLNNSSPTGFESSGQHIWLDYIRPYIDTWYTDTYGSAIAIINPEAPYKVVIEAHADEISWFVNYIDKNG